MSHRDRINGEITNGKDRHSIASATFLGCITRTVHVTLSICRKRAPIVDGVAATTLRPILSPRN